MFDVLKKFRVSILKLSTCQTIIVFLDLMGVMITVPILGIVSGILEPKIFSKYFKSDLFILDKYHLILLLIAYFVMKIIISYFVNKKFLRTITLLQAKLQMEIFESLLNKKLIYYYENDSAKLIRDSTTEVSIFINKVVGPISILMSESVIVIVFLLFIAYINIWLLVTIVFIFISVIAVNKNLQKKIIKNISREIQSNARLMYTVTQEAFQSIKIILVYNNQNFFIRKFSDYSYKYIENANKIISINFISRNILELFFIVFIVFFLILMKILNANNIPEIFIGITAFGLRLLPSISRINNSMNDIHEGMASYGVIKNLWKH
jgi:ABC-type multidrug transport system fused ATPase/permease subunit